jgi:protease-4
MSKKQKRILHVRLEGEVVEGKAGLGFFGRPQRDELQRLIRTVRKAGEDRKIGGLLLRLAEPELGWSKAASLARAIGDFRRSGKPTVAFLEGAGNIDFALACACETLVMPPSATLHLYGLQAEAIFVRDLLGWAGVEAELEAVGEYKSAGEMFRRREMSVAHREELTELLNDLSDQMIDATSKGRSLEPTKIVKLLDNGPYLAEEAMDAGLIDRVAPEDECESLLVEALGTEIALVPHGRYRVGEGWFRRALTYRRSRIAVLNAVGIINSGEARRSQSPRPVVGARSFGALLKRVRESRRVKAVVIRVESPGGAALASELIRREIDLTRKTKPVVVSMGDVAASGGYYIASAADAILAEASTLTGSIGIVGGKVVVRKLLDKLGIHRETVSVSARSTFLTPFHSFSLEERRRLRRHLLFFYEKLFVPRVAAGRKLTHDEVDKVGRGRVWTGRMANERGLVDGIGDLDAAVALARKKAGIPPSKKTRTVTYAKRSRFRHLLFDMPWNKAGFVPTERHLSLLSGLGMPQAGSMLDWLELVAQEDVVLMMPRLLKIK